MSGFNLSDILGDDLPDDADYEVWDDQPGGKVVKTYVKDGQKLVDVEFKHSPGEIYTYLKD